jgi:integrase
MKHGTVYQRHLMSCPRDDDGTYLPHRCRGAWGYVIDLPRGADGRRRQATKSGFPTRAAARTAMQEVAALLVSDFPMHSLTVGEYLEEWLQGKHALKASTRAHYADAIRLYLKPHIGHVQLMGLRVEHLDRMYAAIRVGVRGRPLSNGSIRRVHACLSSALSTAAKRRLITHNPAQYVELPPENPTRTTPWTVEQARAFLVAVEHDRLAALYHLLIVTGMRRGEAIGLRWDDVDLGRRQLMIAQQITEIRGRPTVSTPKSRKGTRLVPLDAWTVEVLVGHAAAQREERGQWWLPPGSQLVFTREDGTPLRPEYVTRHFKRLAREAGLPDVRLHDLRHANASIALEAGVDVKVVSERLGHANTAITSDIYTHVSTALGRSAADRIGAFIAGPVPAAHTGERGWSADASSADVSEMFAPEPSGTLEGDDPDA